MASLGVPLVPGSAGALADLDEAAKVAAEADIAAEARNEQETAASMLARAALERAELRLSARS